MPAPLTNHQPRGPLPVAPVAPLGGAYDRASVAIRCVVAAETYKLTGSLPRWVSEG